MSKKLIYFISGLVLLGGIGVWYFIYGKDRSQHLLYIPKEVTFAVHFDLKSLHDKSNFEKVKKMKFFSQMMEKRFDRSGKNEFVDILTKNPQSTGVDLLSQPVVFYSTRNDKVFGGLALKLSSSGDFNRFIKKYETSSEPKKSKEYTSLFLEDDNLVVAWNDDAALFLTAPTLKYRSNSKAELEKVLDIYMTQEEDESLYKNGEYKTFRKSGYDIGAFMSIDKISDFALSVFNRNAFMSEEELQSKNTINEFSKKYKNLYTGLGLLFDDNNITLKTVYYGEGKDKLKNDLFFNAKGLNQDIIQMISNKEVYGTFFGSINIDKLIRYYSLILPESEKKLSEAASMLDMSVNDIKSIFGGDFAFSWIDLKNEPKIRTYETLDDNENFIMRTDTYYTYIPSFSLAVQIKNQQNFNKLIEGINHPKIDTEVESGMEGDMSRSPKPPHRDIIVKDGEHYSMDFGGQNIYIVKNGNYYTLTNNQELANGIKNKKFVNGGFKVVNKEFFSQYPIGMKLNLSPDNFPKDLHQMAVKNMGDISKKKAENLLNNFKDISMYVANTDQLEGNIVINLKEGKGNSLYRILEIIDEIDTF